MCKQRLIVLELAELLYIKSNQRQSEYDHNKSVDLSPDASSTLHDPLPPRRSTKDEDLQVSNLNLSFSSNIQTSCRDNPVHNKDGNSYVVTQTPTQS